MDFSKPRIRPAAARSKPNAPCKKHPKHRQSPGICSLCLNEKLSKLTIHGRFPKPRGEKMRFSCSSSSYISSLSSSNASSCSSPIVLDRKSIMRVFKKVSLKKSRSMAFEWQRRRDGEIREVGLVDTFVGKEK